MYLQFHGAADGVTGSLHRVHVEDEAKQALADGLKEAGVPEVILSRPGDRIEL